MATPTLVQYRTVANQQGNLSTLMKVKLPNAVLSGNCVVVCIQIGSGKTISTLTDDQSNTYTQGVSNDDGNQIVMIYYSANVTNGPQEIQVTFGGTGANFVGAEITEWYNVKTTSPADGTGKGRGSGTSLTLNTGAGGTSLVTTVDGDLIIAFGVQDSNSNKITSWTKRSGYTLLAADLEDSLAVEYLIQSTHGTIDGTTAMFTMSPSQSWNLCALALQNATAGTAPSTSNLRIIGIHGAAVNRNGTGTSETCSFPMFGNAQVIAFIGVSADILSACTDTAGNTWTTFGANNVNGGSGNVRIMDCLSPASVLDTDLLTLTLSGAGAVPGDTAFLYDLFVPAGFTLSRDGSAVITTGTDSGGGATFNGGTITPTTSGGLVLFTIGVTSKTLVASSVSHGTGIFLPRIDPNQEFSPWPADENNGWMRVYNADTTAIQSTWDPDGTVDAWAETAVAYKLVADITLFAQSVM